MMLNPLAMLAALSMLSPSPASTSPGTATSGKSAPGVPDVGPGIVVDGHKLTEKDITAAVHDIGRPSSTGGFDTQFARWDEPVCIGVAGLPAQSGEYVADRLGAIARDLGIHTDPPGCQAINVIVIFTTDPAGLIERARNKIPSLLSGSSPALLEQLSKRDDAVRAVASTTFSSGQGGPSTTSSFGSPIHNYATLPQWNASHIIAPTQTHLERMTVIVDARQIEGLTYTQLSAYLAMAAFAQIDTHVPAPAVTTILSLFPRGAANTTPPDLSAFDQAYLRALYAVNPALPGDQQRLTMIGSIQKIMTGLATNKRLQSPDGAPLGSGPRALGVQANP